MNVESAVYWDPYNTDFAVDPYPIYQRMREETPLYYNEEYDFYALSRFADCERNLPDYRTFPSSRGGILEMVKSGIKMPPGSLIFEDPPEHNIHRGLLTKLFTPRRVTDLEPQVRDFTERTLDRLVGMDRFDIVEEVSRQIPMRVVGMLFGIPEQDQVAIRDSADQSLSTEGGGQMDLQDGGVMTNHLFADYIDYRQKNPGDDLISLLLTTEFEDENGVRRTLTQDEVLTYVTVVAGAGNETTGRLIGWMASVFAQHPDQRREVAEDPSLIPNAIEELLRFEPPGPFIARYVAEDVELYNQTVPEGSAMMFMVGAANRDPRRYTDGERFDIHRKIGHQLTFGLGIHYCLGASLARLEGRVALEEWFKRFPSWDVDWDQANMAQTSSVRGWETLPLVIR